MASEGSPLIFVIKVGGSLFDLQGLGSKLETWLRSLPSQQIVIIPGGGSPADAVRDFDRCHSLGDERAHWLALAALSLNARLLEGLLPGSKLVHERGACEASWSAGLVPVLDPYPFVEADERRQGSLPHCWTVTSDSIAARVARIFGACQLILLKSIAIPTDLPWSEASRQGYVDGFFPKAAAGLNVRAVNFRTWSP